MSIAKENEMCKENNNKDLTAAFSLVLHQILTADWHDDGTVSVVMLSGYRFRCPESEYRAKTVEAAARLPYYCDIPSLTYCEYVDGYRVEDEVVNIYFKSGARRYWRVTDVNANVLQLNEAAKILGLKRDE